MSLDPSSLVFLALAVLAAVAVLARSEPLAMVLVFSVLIVGCEIAGSP